MAMQKLNVRFSDEVKDKISETAIMTGVSDSEVARTAMNLGLLLIRREEIKIEGTNKIIYPYE